MILTAPLARVALAPIDSLPIEDYRRYLDIMVTLILQMEDWDQIIVL